MRTNPALSQQMMSPPEWRSVFSGAWRFGSGDTDSSHGPAKTASRLSQSAIAGVPVSTLLTRLRHDDPAALTTIYDALFPTLWRLARLRTGSADEAAEVVQETFLALWMRRAAIEVTTDIRVYLSVAVRNRTRKLRAHDDVVRAVDTAVSDAVLDAPALGQSIPQPDVAAESADFYAAYHRAIAALSAREREAALLRWEEGFTFEQIGQILGVSTGGTRKVILRAQEKVQGLLADFGPLP